MVVFLLAFNLQCHGNKNDDNAAANANGESMYKNSKPCFILCST